MTTPTIRCMDGKPRPLKVLVGRTHIERTLPFNIERLAPPDTALLQKMLTSAREKLLLPTLNHSLRVYCYGVERPSTSNED